MKTACTESTEYTPCSSARRSAFHNLGPSGTRYSFEYVEADLQTVIDVLDLQLDEYNQTSGVSPMVMVLFAEAAEHVARIARIVNLPGGGGHIQPPQPTRSMCNGRRAKVVYGTISE